MKIYVDFVLMKKNYRNIMITFTVQLSVSFINLPFFY